MLTSIILALLFKVFLSSMRIQFLMICINLKVRTGFLLFIYVGRKTPFYSHAVASYSSCYITAFCRSLGVVLMLYDFVWILLSSKAFLWFVTKSPLSQVADSRQKRFGPRLARHTVVPRGHADKKNRRKCRSWLRWMSLPDPEGLSVHQAFVIFSF